MVSSDSVCLSVCLSVCGWALPKEQSIRFGGNPDHYPDSGFLLDPDQDPDFN